MITQTLIIVCLILLFLVASGLQDNAEIKNQIKKTNNKKTESESQTKNELIMEKELEDLEQKITAVKETIANVQLKTGRSTIKNDLLTAKKDKEKLQPISVNQIMEAEIQKDKNIVDFNFDNNSVKSSTLSKQSNQLSPEKSRKTQPKLTLFQANQQEGSLKAISSTASFSKKDKILLKRATINQVEKSQKRSFFLFFMISITILLFIGIVYCVQGKKGSKWGYNSIPNQENFDDVTDVFNNMEIRYVIEDDDLNNDATDNIVQEN